MAADRAQGEPAELQRRLFGRAQINTFCLACAALVLTWVTVAQPYRSQSPAIRSDGVGYHAWTRALLVGDLSFCAWGTRDKLISYTDPARAFCQNKYPMGLAVLRFPFMAWFVDTSAQPPVITTAEHTTSLVLGACVVWLSTALALWTASLLRLAPARSAIMIVLGSVGTGFFHYGTYDSAFTHAYSALIMSILLAFGVREYRYETPVPAAVLSSCAYFLVALRMTNIASLSWLCAAFVIVRPRSRRELVRYALWVGAGVAVAVLSQLAYNYYALGSLSVNSYGQESFRWDRPMQHLVLLSYERGLLTYYPLFGLVLGVGLTVRGARSAAILLLVMVLTYVTLYGYWHSWPLGGGFGHRGFVELTPIVLLVSCISASRLSRNGFAVYLSAAVACVFVSTSIMRGYWLGTFPVGGAKSQVYWRHVRWAESVLTGGTTCKPSRCDVLHATCTRYDAPELTHCMANGHDGLCGGTGTCAAIVNLRSLAHDASRLVTAPPFDLKPAALTARSRERGPWEDFLVVPVPGSPSQVYLRSVLTGRYVTVPVVHARPRPLVADAVTPGPHEVFTRVGPDQAASFLAWNGRYVSAQADAPGEPAQLIATAQERGANEQFAIEPRKP